MTASPGAAHQFLGPLGSDDPSGGQLPDNINLPSWIPNCPVDFDIEFVPGVVLLVADHQGSRWSQTIGFLPRGTNAPVFVTTDVNLYLESVNMVSVIFWVDPSDMLAAQNVAELASANCDTTEPVTQEAILACIATAIMEGSSMQDC